MGTTQGISRLRCSCLRRGPRQHLVSPVHPSHGKRVPAIVLCGPRNKSLAVAAGSGMDVIANSRRTLKAQRKVMTDHVLADTGLADVEAELE